MDFEYISFSWLAFYVGLAFATTGEHFDRLLEYNDKVCMDSSLLFTVYVPNLPACLSSCKNHENCTATMYDKDKQTCFGCLNLLTLGNRAGTLTHNRRIYLVTGKYGIPDSQLSASSKYGYVDKDFHAARRARFNYTVELTDGEAAWTAATQDQNQYIQAQFTNLRLVVAVATLGRLRYDQKVTKYSVLHSTDCLNFVDIAHSDGTNQEYLGNSDPLQLAVNRLTPPVEALCVRIIPLEWTYLISMRFDLIGNPQAVTA